MIQRLRYPNSANNYGMTVWERLQRYGKIERFLREGDPQVYNAYLVAGRVKIVKARMRNPVSVIAEVYSKEHYITIDEFLWLFLRNLPCDYPQYRNGGVSAV